MYSDFQLDETTIFQDKYYFRSSYSHDMRIWLNGLSDISEMYYNRQPFSLSNLHLLDKSLLFGFTNREHILVPLKLVKDLGFIPVMHIEGLRKPKEYRFGSGEFSINLDTLYVSKKPFEYLTNVNAYKLVSDANKILEIGSKETFAKPLFNIGGSISVLGRRMSTMDFRILLHEAQLMKNFAIKYSSSRRLLPIQKLIQLVFETSMFDCVRGFHWSANPILYALKMLLSHFNTFPFREVGTDVEYLSSCSMLLPELCFALCELWFKYTLLDMTPDELRVGILILFEWGQISLDSAVLKFKDSRLNLSKLLLQISFSIRGIRWYDQAPCGTVTINEPNEVWKDEIPYDSEDYRTYQNEFMMHAPSTLVTYLREIGIIKGNEFIRNRVIDNLTEVRRLYIVINVLCQHGLFIKNPVVLTIEKSILPRASISFVPKRGTFMHNLSVSTVKLPYELSWNENPIFFKMYAEGRKIAAAYKEKYNKLDLNAEYIKALTNNSGGVDYVPTAKEVVDVPSQVLRAFGKKRLMYFILNPILYESYSNWMSALTCITSSGERKQIDRRPRVIQMVSNAAQLAPFLLFMLVDLMGHDEPELSSKKNTGTIVDIIPLLIATSNEKGVQESADISGMDASTTKTVMALVEGVLIEVLKECNHCEYFFAQSKCFDIYDADGVKLRSEKVHPGIQVLKLNDLISENLNYRLNIPEFSAFGVRALMDTSPHVFPSGKFSTNAQHSLLNLLLLRVFKASLITELLGKRIFVSDLSFKISGDDIFAALRLDHVNDEAARIFSNKLVEIFASIGFKLGSILSRFTATFLQQSAILGTVLPKPDRISITTSERGESLRVETLDSFAETRDILKELCGRVHYPSNVKGLSYGIANALRRIRVSSQDDQVYKKLIILDNQMYSLNKKIGHKYGLKEEFLPIRLIIGQKYNHIILPVISMFISDGFDLPFPAIFLQGSLFSEANAFSPRGSIGDWKLRRALKLKGTDVRHYKLSAPVLDLISQSAGATISRSDTSRFAKKLYNLLDSSILTYLRTLYNHDIAELLGLSWFKWYLKFNMSETINRIRISQFPKSMRDDWAKVLEFRLNFDAIIKSRIAGARLSLAGFKVPFRLAFYNSPVERITQAITSTSSSDGEFKLQRTAILMHMLNFQVNYDWMKTVEEEVLYTLDYELTDVPLLPTKSFIVDVYGELMLSSGNDLDRDFLLYKYGLNMYDLSIQFSGYYALTPGPYKDYKHEELIQFASKVYNQKSSLLYLVWELANVHSRYRAKLENILRFGEANEITPWKSIIHTRQNFELSTSVRHNRRIWVDYNPGDDRVFRILQPILRDIGISENEIILRKARVIVPSVVLYIHGGLKSKVSSLIVTDKSNLQPDS
uniref:RNA-dependent RNA polymerase n=1 Tax=Hubei diptera virus 21 TaxID=1922882 RepID=A0A1L3KP58_9VIRU|nr:RNA-dependent RNA polymerase [Hubei diptera virus 21]